MFQIFRLCRLMRAGYGDGFVDLLGYDDNNDDL